MGTKAAGSRAGELAEVKRGFDRWRQSRQRGRQIPEPLWRMAVKAAISHGVQSTARRLGLNSTRLQKQVQRLAPAQAAQDTTSCFNGAILGLTECDEGVSKETNPSLQLKVSYSDGGSHDARPIIASSRTPSFPETVHWVGPAFTIFARSTRTGLRSSSERGLCTPCCPMGKRGFAEASGGTTSQTDESQVETELAFFDLCRGFHAVALWNGRFIGAAYLVRPPAPLEAEHERTGLVLRANQERLYACRGRQIPLPAA